jgi:regulator of RNase E activity RraA
LTNELFRYCDHWGLSLREVVARRELRQREFPVYARGVAQVMVGGMIVHRGDIIVGNEEDGVLTIAPADVDAVIERTLRQHAKQAAARASIANGSSDRAWVTPQRNRMMNP